ncbi:hypothetical protein Celaphus_00018090, partial [Cervus elaphus hippelaphus]
MRKEATRGQYDILTAVSFPGGLGLLIKVDEFGTDSLCDQGLVINEEIIEWPIGFREMQSSVSSAQTKSIQIVREITASLKLPITGVSDVLLISLLLCFLCCLLFIAHPNMATCILRQITFGAGFTVAVSAKTLTVILAFKARKPGRTMRYQLVTGASNYVIPMCSLIQ